MILCTLSDLCQNHRYADQISISVVFMTQ
jgi:hypothetical protein